LPVALFLFSALESMDQPKARAEQWAPYVVGALFALPVLIAKYPPMDDLPLHEASVGLLRHWADTHFAPRSLYYLNIGHSNQLFSFLVLLFSFLVPMIWASKIVVAGAVFALPLAAARFADHVGASRWTVLIAAPVGCLGWMFFWGLIQNIIGLGVLLALLPAIDRFASQPTGKGAVRMCGAMLLLHFSHQVMQLVALAALLLCSIGAAREAGSRGRRTVWLALPIVFSAAIGVAANRYSWHLSGPRHRRTTLFIFYSLWHKIESFSGVLFAGYEPYVRNLMLALAMAPVALLLVRRWRARPAAMGPLAEQVHAWRFELLALGLLVAYFVMPANFRGTTLIYHRFLPTAWFLFVICAGIGSGPLRLATRLLACVPPLASLLISWPVFADSHRVYTDLEPLLDRIEIGSPVLTLNLGPHRSFRLWSPVDAAGHVVAVRGGRSLFDYTLSPISPVTQRPAKQWIDAMDRLDGNPYGLRPDWDLTRFRYLLLNTSLPQLAAVVTMALKDEARLKADNGSWYLFETRLPVIAFDADDAPLPEPHPVTLRHKLRQLARDLGEDITEPSPAQEAAEDMNPTR
jgi:hypothetical protein